MQLRKVQDKTVNMVVAIGGGSVMDKEGNFAMMNMNEPVMTFLEGVGRRIIPGQNFRL
jgi:alcohol dehydrogenase class IV